MERSVDQLNTRVSASHLRLVIAIAEENSLVGAAKRLNMTASAATKALQAAEHQLGIPLFNRTSVGMVPTVYGTALITRARLVISQLNRAAQEINDLRDGLNGRIAVGTLLAGSAGLLPAAISRVRHDRPGLVVTVMEGTDDVLLPSLRRGELDLVVGRLTEFHERTDLAQEALIRDIACVVTRPDHPLTRRRDLVLADLLAWDWILPPHETTLRAQIDKAFLDESIDPPMPAVESVVLVMNRALVLSTDYLSVWPWQVAGSEAAAGNIAVLPIRLAPTAGPIGITLRRDAIPPPAVEIFIATLRAVAREMPPSPLLGTAPAGMSA
jgi:DNA-binding transcriptional LysR family regulator